MASNFIQIQHKVLAFLLPIFFWLLLLTPTNLLAQDCVNPADLTNNTLEVCYGEIVTFCPEAEDVCYKWLSEESFYPYDFHPNLTTFEIIEDIVITLVKTDDEGNLVEIININIVVDNLRVKIPEFNGFCQDGEVTLEPELTGGSGDFNYLWSTGETTSTITVSPNEFTTYSLKIEDLETGCIFNLNTSAEIREPLEIAILADEIAICQEDMSGKPSNKSSLLTDCTNPYVTLDVHSTTNANSHTYNWSIGEATASIDAFEVGVYEVTVTNDFGCTAIATHEVFSCAQIAIESTIQANNGNIEYLLEVDAGAGYTFEWNDENQSIGSSLIVTEAGDYTVTALSPGGCQVTETFRVDFPCKMPDDGGYIYTPDQAGLLIPTGTPLEFYGTEGQVKIVHDNISGQTFETDLGNFQGYLSNGNPNPYTNGSQIGELPFVFQGIQEYNTDGECVCKIYKTEIPSGTNFVGTPIGTAPNNYTLPNFPFPPNSYVNDWEDSAPDAYCISPNPQTGFDNNDLVDLILDEGVLNSVNPNNIDGDFNEIPEYLTLNGYNTCYYLYDRQIGILKIYPPGTPSSIQTISNPSEIKTKLEEIQQGNISSNKDFISFFEINSDKLRFDIIFRDGAMTPAVGDWVDYPESDYQAIAQASIRFTYSQLSDLDTPVYTDEEPILDPNIIVGPHDGKLETFEERIFKLIAFYGDQFVYITKNAETDPAIWNNESDKYNKKPLHIWVPIAGATDQGMLEIKDLKELVVFFGQFKDDPMGTITPIYEGLSNLTVQQVQTMVFQGIQDEFDKITEDSNEGQHQRSKAVTKGTVKVFKAGGGGAAILSVLLGHLQKITKFLKKFSNPAIKDKIDGLDFGRANSFLDDFKNIDADDIAKFDANPELIDSWSAMIASPSARRVMKNVETLSTQINKHAAKLDDFKLKFKNATEAGREKMLKQIDVFFGFKSGQFPEDIVAVPKGSRPEPSSYLTSNYIAEHLVKFDDGAIRFTSNAAHTKYGTLGPDGGFVLPKNEFDNVITETGGNIAQIEQKLGLDPGYLDGDDVLIAWVKKEDFNNVKIPSGNEGGANLNWLPGGKTSGGVSEVVMDFSGKPPFTEINL